MKILKVVDFHGSPHFDWTMNPLEWDETSRSIRTEHGFPSLGEPNIKDIAKNRYDHQRDDHGLEDAHENPSPLGNLGQRRSRCQIERSCSISFIGILSNFIRYRIPAQHGGGRNKGKEEGLCERENDSTNRVQRFQRGWIRKQGLLADRFAHLKTNNAGRED